MAIRDLAGLGPKSEQMLAAIGIETVEGFMAADAFELYLQLRAQQPGLSLNMLYAMLGAQQNRPWQEVAREDKTAILMRLDDLNAAPR